MFVVFPFFQPTKLDSEVLWCFFFSYGYDFGYDFSYRYDLLRKMLTW